MKLLGRAWRILVQNFWWRVLAVVIAVSIWAVVASEPELSTFATVPVEYRNLPEDLEMTSPPAENVTLELRGPAGELRGLTESRSPSVVLDMSNITPGVHRFVIDGGNVRLARGVYLEHAIPPEVRFEFDRRLTRSVPVKVRFTGEAEHGTVVNHYEVMPQELTIVGPARRVEHVTAALTDPIEVPSVAGVSHIQVPAFVEDPYIRIQSSPVVTVAITTRNK